jgi:hypothetical protein
MKKQYIAPTAKHTDIDMKEAAFTNISVTGTGIKYNSSDTGDPSKADSRKRHNTQFWGSTETNDDTPSFWDTEY